MVFAFLEDGTLVVHESVVDASRQYEGIDVESGVVRFYDESGTFLEPRFTTPNRAGRTLGLFRWVVSGTYELVANPAAGEDPFALALHETSVLEPNRWYASLDDLKATLAARGVAVTLRVE
jgi:hypothetical protein